MEAKKYRDFSCVSSVVACFVLSVIYVASLYVWNSPLNRDHPSTIKRRFFSVFIMMFISPLFLYCFSSEEMLQKASLLQLMGFRLPGLFPALVIPLFLTMVLFLGPLSMQGVSGLLKLYAEPMYWVSNARSLIWLRNHVVAPLSEELTFRACMLPLLLQCFRPMTAVFVCPLFFGVAHFHHMVERMRTGLDFRRSLMLSFFQFSYTTLFGAYSAFLFAKTDAPLEQIEFRKLPPPFSFELDMPLTPSSVIVLILHEKVQVTFELLLLHSAKIKMPPNAKTASRMLEPLSEMNRSWPTTTPDNALKHGPDVKPQASAPDQPVMDSSLQRAVSTSEASQEAETVPRTGSTITTPQPRGSRLPLPPDRQLTPCSAQALVTAGGMELVYDKDMDVKIEDFDLPETDTSQQGPAPEPDGQTTPEAGR